ncbi:alpha/beta fold hydrolase [Xenorhabdus innexi]|uniref:Epoxide hydrolase n=1 Tax=Xenorhabdus innexi TaxID=290109 RepID=A0A1N6MV28_9GAMM|nr:alpha/beta hydrolase [Xenorhabdus innexi]PHM29984.1 epoxide hydrolase [Xenorhabdus innexi]SIP72634.1 putative Epoxide hydrolase [Xenorhabdus innexi]
MATTHNDIHYYNVSTRYARISVLDSGGNGLPVLFIHGNSSSKDVFFHQIEYFKNDYRVLALDLPGHGLSSNASEPRKAYSMPAYAQTVIEVLEKIGINRVVVFGWSLGGHIGLEMLALFPKMIGLMICGTPPVSAGKDSVAQGFCLNDHMGLAAKADFTEEDVKIFAYETVGINAPHEQFIFDAVARTDGLSRQYMFEAFTSPQATDQRLLAETSKIPLAIVNGSGDPFINAQYIGSLNYQHLWRDQVISLAGVDHAPFWEAPAQFNPILADFLCDF